MEKTRLNELYINVDKNFFWNEYFKSYNWKTEKNAKIADFANFGPKYLGPQIFPDMRFVAVKLEKSCFGYI